MEMEFGYGGGDVRGRFVVFRRFFFDLVYFCWEVVFFFIGSSAGVV